MSVCVVGRGKVGRSLVAALREAGVACVLVPGTRFRAVAARVYVLAVPDGAIAEVATALAPTLGKGACVLHTAGARGLDELAAVSARGAAVGVMHPLVSFASAHTVLRGATFTCFGDRAALLGARRLARAVAAHAVTIAPPDAAYHAAAALLANGAAALAHLGAQVLMALGFERRAAARALASLLRSVADNIDAVGVPAALTGPVVRGDARTVERHLAALDAKDPELARAYAALQPVIVTSALAAGLDAAKARRILALPALKRPRRATPLS